MRYLEKYCSLSVTALKKNGVLRMGERSSCRLAWEFNGRPVADCIATIDLQGPPRVVLSYRFNGVKDTQYISMIFRASNLGTGGYYLFVCPATGKPSRKLYLNDGRFVCREAVGAPYRSQADNYLYKKYKAAYRLQKLYALEDMAGRRRVEYAGRPTAYARQLARAAKIAGQVS